MNFLKHGNCQHVSVPWIVLDCHPSLCTIFVDTLDSKCLLYWSCAALLISSFINRNKCWCFYFIPGPSSCQHQADTTSAPVAARDDSTSTPGSATEDNSTAGKFTICNCIQYLVLWILNSRSKSKQGAQNMSCLGPPDVKGQPWWWMIQTDLMQHLQQNKVYIYSQKKVIHILLYYSLTCTVQLRQPNSRTDPRTNLKQNIHQLKRIQ